MLGLAMLDVHNYVEAHWGGFGSSFVPCGPGASSLSWVVAVQLWCVAWVGTALLGRQRRVASIVLARLCLVPCVGRSALHLADACEGVAKIIQLSVDPQSVRGMILRVWPVLLQLVCFAIVVALARRSFATGLPRGWHWLALARCFGGLWRA